MRTILGIFAALFLVLGFAGCEKGAEEIAGEESTAESPEEAAPTLQVDHGVDSEAKVIRIGMLNEESGPAAAIGRPFAVGKRLLALHVNAGGERSSSGRLDGRVDRA